MVSERLQISWKFTVCGRRELGVGGLRGSRKKENLTEGQRREKIEWRSSIADRSLHMSARVQEGLDRSSGRAVKELQVNRMSEKEGSSLMDQGDRL